MPESVSITIDREALNEKLALFTERQGDYHRAREITLALLAKNPQNPVARLVQSRLHARDGQPGRAQSELQTLLKDLPRQHAIRATVHFDLAEHYEAQGAYRAALVHWGMANKAQLQNRPVRTSDKERYLGQIRRLRTFNYSKLPKYRFNDGFAAPVFMVGFPRSGTTLLHQMLSDHDAITVMEEEPILHQLDQKMVRARGDRSRTLQNLTKPEIAALRREYFEGVRKVTSVADGATFVDKLPLSMIHLPLIRTLFPDSKVILSLRHPCDTVLSNFAQQYALNDAMANFSSLRDAAHLYLQVFDLWEQTTEQMRAEFHTTRYESLVTDTDGEQGALMRYLGLSWSGERLQHQAAATEQFIKTPSFRAVRQPLYSSSIDRWRNYQSLAEWLPEVLAPYIERYGYQR